MNISFLNLRFDPFSIIAKEVNQIRSKEVCVVACLVSLKVLEVLYEIFISFTQSETFVVL